MSLDGYGELPASAGKRWFIITAADEPHRVLDRFEAPGWAPAILEYAARLQRDAYPDPASLREARPEEVAEWTKITAGSASATRDATDPDPTAHEVGYGRG